MYVGQTKRNPPSARWAEHKRTAQNGGGSHLHHALRKYGHENFEFKILEAVDSAEEADAAETFWIDFFGLAEGHGYNVAAGGAWDVRAAHKALAHKRKTYPSFASDVARRGRQTLGADGRKKAIVAANQALANLRKDNPSLSSFVTRTWHSKRSAAERSATVKKRALSLSAERLSEIARKGHVTRKLKEKTT